MSEVSKPITMVVDDFKVKAEDLFNNSGLPAWLMLYILEPYLRQLQQISEAVKKQEKEEYENALSENNAKE